MFGGEWARRKEAWKTEATGDTERNLVSRKESGVPSRSRILNYKRERGPAKGSELQKEQITKASFAALKGGG